MPSVLEASRKTLGATIISLTPTEERTLFFLLENEGRCVTLDMLFQEILPATSDAKNLFRVTMSHLRDKLRPSGRDVCIRSIRGEGWMWDRTRENRL